MVKRSKRRMLGCNKRTTLRTIIHSMVWVVFRSLLFFSCLTKRRSVFLVFFSLRLFHLGCRWKRERASLQYTMPWRQCYNLYILCVCVPFPGNVSVLSLLLSLTHAFIDLHIVHLFSRTGISLSVCMFKLDYIVFYSERVEKKRDDNSSLTQETDVLK